MKRKRLIFGIMFIFLLIENIQSQDLSVIFQQGKSNLKTGNWETALNDFHVLKEIATKKEDTLYLALAFEYEGKALMHEKTKSGYQLAKSLYETAIKYFKSLNDKRGLYRCYQRLGMINRDLKQPQIGKKNLYESLFYARTLTNKPDSAIYELGTAYRWLGTTYKILGEKDSSLHYLTASYDVMQNIDSFGCKNYYRAESIINLISVELSKNMVNDAINHLFELENYISLDTCLNHFGYFLHAQKGKINRENKKYDEALENYQTAIEYCKYNNRKNCEVEMLNSIGLLHYKKGDLDKAIKTYKKAIKILNADDITYSERIKINNTLGALYSKKEDYLNAKIHLKKALDIAKEHLPNTAEFLRMQRNYAIFLIEQNNTKQGLLISHQSLLTNATDFKSRNIEDNPTIHNQYLDKEELFESLVTKAYAARLLMNEDCFFYGNIALSTLNLADSILFQLKLSLSYEQDKIRLISQPNFKELYYIGTKACFKMYERTGDKTYLKKALGYIEKSKSNTLFEEINIEATYKKNGASELEIKNFKKNTVEIKQIQKSLKTLDKQTNEYKIAFKKLKTLSNSIDYFQLNYVQKTPYLLLSGTSTVEKIQSKLKEEEVILNFLEIEDSLFLLIIKKDNIEGISYKLDEALKLQINNYRNSIDSSYLPYKFYPISYKLYQSLIIPIKNHLEGKSRVIIIPHGSLNIYFDALIANPSTDKNSFATFKYLIDDLDISYHYFSSLWCTIEEKPRNNNTSYIGLAPFVQSTLKTNIENEEILLEKLPHTKNEVNFSKQIFEPKQINIALDKEAYLGFPSNKKLSSEIIHYATHSAFINGKVYYFLLNDLGQPVNFTKEDLYLHSFLDCNLLIFSSCNSGQGNYIDGEGVMSIIRPALYQGIPNIVVTSNPVRDNFSAELIQYFLQYISEKETYSSAINKAKRVVKNQDVFPASWASYILIGK